MGLHTSDFDYPLEAELIAQQPLERRDRSRLMVLDRAARGVSHRVFTELPSLLRPGDLLVLNDTRVIPARFFCRRRTGGKIEGLFLHEPAAGQWEVLLKGADRCREGETLALEGVEGLTLELRRNRGAGEWLVAATPPRPAAEVLQHAGRTPLPPYIRRPDAAQDASDRARYQTVYASRAGAVAAPTAGLHFTEALLETLRLAGIDTAWVTLHVGAGTFTPVTTEDLAAHRMHREWYDLPAATADKLNAARRQGRRIVAIGTTSVRVLETVARLAPGATQSPRPARAGLVGPGFSRPMTGWTDIFLYPPAEFLATDALLTNFHLPRSTLLMLTAAFCSPGRTDGLKTILDAYAEARRERYRFYSYGDAMLIV